MSSQTTSDKSTLKRRPKLLRFSRSLSAVLILIVIVAVIRHIAAPVHGHTINEKLALKSPVATRHHQRQLPASNITNSYFDLNLPPGYSVQAANQTVPGLLYQQTIIKPADFGSLVINVAIKALPAGGLAGDPSYNTRQQQSMRYHLSNQVTSNGTATIANDTQSAAVVAFWPHASYLATLSVASGLANPPEDKNSQLLQALTPLLAAWSWR